MTGWLWRRLRSLRYLLGWPLILAYRRCARRSLRWRLTGSHLLTLLIGLATALSLVGLLSAFGALATDPAREEPANDARAAATILTGLNILPPNLAAPANEDISRVLDSMVARKVTFYRGPRQSQFAVQPAEHFHSVASISIIETSGAPWAHSTSAAPSSLPVDAGSVLARALAGSTNLATDSFIRPGRQSGGLGAYPLYAADGSQLGAVLVDKFDLASPSGRALFRAELRPVLQTVWVGSILVFLPGLLVALIFAVRSSRNVGGRVQQLSRAAEALAAGQLSQRVAVGGEDEVASLATSFNAMASQLEETMSRVETERARAVMALDANRQLVANVSHELRTPVALIRGQLEGSAEEAGDERIQMALRETDRLEHLIDDLFELARAEAAALKVEIADFDAGKLVHEAVSPLVEPARREASVSVFIEAPATGRFARGDRQRLVRVLQNVVRNAVRHTPEGGLILVRLTQDSDAVTISVSDTGEGIAAEDLPHIFDRFYRGDASRNRALGGAGLGLAIAREFVEAMGGTITADSCPTGTTISVSLAAASRGSSEPPGSLG